MKAKSRRVSLALSLLLALTFIFTFGAKATAAANSHVNSQSIAVEEASSSNSPTFNPSDKISSFDSNIFITRAGTARITETIIYSNDAPHHGLERFVPTLLTDKDSGKLYFYKFKLSSVKNENGQDYQVSRHDDMGFAKLRIGDPDKTFTGAATYVISYELSPVISSQNGFDFLNLNITGNDWRIPIVKTRANVEIEGNPEIGEAVCLTGVVGSKDQNCTATSQAGKYQFVSQLPFNQGEGMTINMKLPPGLFGQYIQTSLMPPFWWIMNWLVGWLLAGLVILFALLRRIYLAIKAWLDKKNQTIVVEYEPPDSMTPAEIGLLADNVSAMPEITATLIELAIRKYLRIEQTKKKTFFSKAKYKFILLNSNLKNLEDYEIKLLETMFPEITTNAEISLDDVDKNKIASAISDIIKILDERLEQKGYYKKSQFFLFSYLKRKDPLARAVKIGVLVVVLSFLFSLSSISISFTQLAIFAGGVLVAVILSIIKRPTKSGLSQWAKIEGFKIFLTMTEKERLKFTDAPDKNPRLFSKMLPYAVALGVEREWAKQFEGMNMAKEMYWYSSSDSSYSPGLFAANMSSMTSQFSSSVSAGFSASSSGGGAGGGSGGGGGGGW